MESEDFKTGKKLVMFATKAYGMGIDIGDIETVYHYAPTGNLNDYVQEIGRAARSENIIGTAAIDFFQRDFGFINRLFGMSAIKQFQVKGVLKKLSQTYKKKNHRNFLVTPNDFSYLFPSESSQGIRDLEAKLKTVLLMIENDLHEQYGFPVMLSRPRSMLSKVYVVIDNDKKDNLIREYGEFLRKVSNGRKGEKQGTVKVSDFGDIYLLDLKLLWEKYYPDLSFASFKYHLLSPKADFDFKYKDCLHQRYRISVFANDKELKMKDLANILALEIDKVNSILDRFKDEGKMFTIKEFESELNKIYKEKDKSKAIASSYINLVSPKTNHKRSIEFNQKFNKYRIVNRSYHNIKREFVLKSDILRKMNLNESSADIFYPKSNKADYDSDR